MWIAQQKTELEELHHIHDTWVKEKDLVESEVNRLRELNRGLRYKVAHPNNKPEADTLMVQLNSSNAVRNFLLQYQRININFVEFKRLIFYCHKF